MLPISQDFTVIIKHLFLFFAIMSFCYNKTLWSFVIFAEVIKHHNTVPNDSKGTFSLRGIYQNSYNAAKKRISWKSQKTYACKDTSLEKYFANKREGTLK